MLIRCPECLTPVPPNHADCPHCGCSMAKPRTTTLWDEVGVQVLLILGLLLVWWLWR